MPAIHAVKTAKTAHGTPGVTAGAVHKDWNGKGGFKPGNKYGKRSHDVNATGERGKLAVDIKNARRTIVDKEDRDTIHRHTKMLRDFDAGKRNITRAHADVIRERLARISKHVQDRASGPVAPKSETVPNRNPKTPILSAPGLTPRPPIRRDRPSPVHHEEPEKVSQPQPHEHDDHEPGYVGNLNTDLIHADPHRFQYKQGHNESGSVGSLAGVQHYDENLAGVIQVWKDPHDNKTYVVNGHNRLEKAKELGAGKVLVRYLGAKDHEEARSIGALTNIAEGRGTALDAAKYFRDSRFTPEDLKSRGVPMREKIATDGLALSRLDKGIFDKIVQGHLTTEQGAIIGKHDLSHSQQRELVKELEDSSMSRRSQITNDHLNELADEAKNAPVARQETRSLFGDTVEEKSLLRHKTKLQANIKKRLSGEKRLFGTVSRSRNAQQLERGGNTIDTEQSSALSRQAAEALDIFDRLKRVSGPVSKILNEAAERIHHGDNVHVVTNHAYDRILEHIPKLMDGGQAFA